MEETIYWRKRAVEAEARVIELAEALRQAEAHDEEAHAFNDLECFVDDPDTRKEFWSEYCRREKQRELLANLEE